MESTDSEEFDHEWFELMIDENGLFSNGQWKYIIWSENRKVKSMRVNQSVEYLNSMTYCQ